MRMVRNGYLVVPGHPCRARLCPGCREGIEACLQQQAAQHAPVSGRWSRAGRGVRASSGVESRRPHDLFMLIFNGFICFIHPETDSQGWLHPITFPHFSVQHTTSSRAQRVTAAPTRRAVRMRAVMACRAVLPPINGAMASAVAVARHPTMIEQRRK